jgi:5-methylphenazine-1-carboxylate 1-monooxygenase
MTGTMASTEILIVGGGIAGLTLALSLHQAGIAVRVYEAVPDLRPLGVGINLQPTAVRELSELGLGEELAQSGIATRELRLCNKLGQLIYREKRGLAAGYRWPQYSIHRGRLQALLLRAVRARIGERNVRSGWRLAAAAECGERVRARFIRHDGERETTDEADVLVGADGIHSAVRRLLHPAESEPRFARQILWRGAVDAPAFLDGYTMVIAGHFDQRIIAYPIALSRAEGLRLTNWICQVTVPDEVPPREAWNRRASAEKVLAMFGAWRYPWLDLPALIERTSAIYEFPLIDRDPVDSWTAGRITLIGDAAHPMYPIGSQAASQAIIDARALTRALLGADDPVRALARYDAERRPVMNDITLRSRRFGPEAALQLVEERAPTGFTRIEDVIAPQELEAITRSFATAAGLDPEAVNGRPSFVPTAIESARA